MLKFAQLATSVKSRYRAADAVTVVAASEQQERTLPGGQGRRSTYDGSIDAPAEAGDEIEGGWRRQELDRLSHHHATLCRSDVLFGHVDCRPAIHQAAVLGEKLVGGDRGETPPRMTALPSRSRCHSLARLCAAPRWLAARAAGGQPAAAPPSAASNSRRPMVTHAQSVRSSRFRS